MAHTGRKRKESTGGAAVALDLERLRRDLDAAEAERADAVRAKHDLSDQRAAALASEDVARLEAHEAAVAAVERRVAVAETKCDRLSGEVAAAEDEAEQGRRRTAYAQAEAGITEARRIIAEEYEPAARALAEILKRAARLQNQARIANADLPDGADPLDLILEPGGFNGQQYRGFRGLTETVTYFVNRETGKRAGPCDCPEMASNAHRWKRVEERVERQLPSAPATPHRSVIEFTNLPGFTAETYIFPAVAWGHARSGPTIETERRTHG